MAFAIALQFDMYSRLTANYNNNVIIITFGTEAVNVAIYVRTIFFVWVLSKQYTVLIKLYVGWE